MKTCLLSLAFLLPQFLNSQTSLSTGMNFRFESQREKYDTPDNPFVLNTYYVISVEQQLKNWMLNGDLMLLSQTHDIKQFTEQQVYGSMGYTTSNTKTTYRAKVNYSYASFKLGASRIVQPKENVSLLIGLFGQADLFANEKEGKHEADKILYKPNWHYNTQTGQMESNPQTVETRDNTVFDAATMTKMVYSGGIQIKPRITFRHFFTELNLSAGATYPLRVRYNIESNYNSKRPTKLFLEAGFKIGYTFR